MKIELTSTQRSQILYYETGFEQLHPNIEIIDWMASIGYKYQQDWQCHNQKHTHDKRSCYIIELPNAEVATAFRLKWL